MAGESVVEWEWNGPTQYQEVKGWAFRVPGGQGVGLQLQLQGPRGSRDGPTGSQGVKM